MRVISEQGLLLLGCGKMGSALLKGWIEAGVPVGSIWINDPAPSDWVKSLGVKLNAGLPAAPAVVLIAVKPQVMQAALPSLRLLGDGKTLFVSVAAGVQLAEFQAILGARTPVVRVMPNTPAAVGQGISALIGNSNATRDHLALTERLMASVGQVVHLDTETQMDAVTGVSGSGPAYVFHLIETLAAAGISEGLPQAMAFQLASATVAGAGALAQASDETPEQLRINVTSPNGTTQAALEVLMDPQAGFGPLLKRAVTAASTRSKELSGG
ncbi:MAG: pyrroline-5-carboxylate reductase [Paracoccaceae bacterium]|nr:pyrroline-5-carboxylate reductase [Paracoccaceae bacterium]